MTRVEFSVTQANVRKDMPIRHIQHDITMVMHLPGIACGNEISSQGAKQAWQKLANSHHKAAVNIGSENPIAVPVDPKYHVLSNQIHDVGESGREGGHPGVEPQRTISEVVLTIGGVPTTILWTHTVSKPFRMPPHKAQAFRNSQWRLHLATMTKMVAAASKAGHMVIYGGDMNNPIPKINGVNHGPINARGRLVATAFDDHIWIAPPPHHTLVKIGSFHERGFTDHPLMHATVGLID
jgi:hypothetical protein